MDTKLLKQKILDLAIHGKLVPQNPNDEPASKLLEKIREEKQKLIAAKKIKADKNDSYIYVGDDNRHYEKFADRTVKDIEDEIPFDVPEGWAWCKMKEILDISSAKRVLQEDWKDSGIPFYRAREIAQLSNGEIVKDDLFITNELYESLKENYGVPQPEDLMVSAVGTIGKTYIVKESDCFYYKDASVLRFSKRLHDINSSFLKLWIESDLIQSQMYAHSNGTTVDTITISTAQEYYFPLPPINEQIKITEEIIKLFQIVNNIETDKSDLQIAIKQAKSKILDLAIHGKLVPQDSSDEPASVLLEKLRAEKESKIKAGELKRDKNDSYIYKNTTDNCYYQKFVDGSETDISDEIPFEIPDNWNWCRLRDIGQYKKGPFGSALTKAMFVPKSENSVKVYEQKNAIKKDHSLGDYYIPREYFESDMKGFEVFPGDILVSCAGTIGETYILPNDIEQGIINQALMKMKITEQVNIEYFFFYFDHILKEASEKSGK